jgi:hypothetical protein
MFILPVMVHPLHHFYLFLRSSLLNFLHDTYIIPFYTPKEIIYVDTCDYVSHACSYASIALWVITCYHAFVGVLL